jgi:hypothetical protein
LAPSGTVPLKGRGGAPAAGRGGTALFWSGIVDGNRVAAAPQAAAPRAIRRRAFARAARPSRTTARILRSRAPGLRLMTRADVAARLRHLCGPSQVRPRFSMRSPKIDFTYATLRRSR